MATLVEALTFVFRKLRGFASCVTKTCMIAPLFSHIQKISLRCGSMKVSFTTSGSPFIILLSRCITILLTELEKTPTVRSTVNYGVF